MELRIPSGENAATVEAGGRSVGLTNLNKIYFPQLALTKGDLLHYYATIAPTLVPHIDGKAIVMKRYPDGVTGKFFYMKRAPSPRPDWVRTCPIEHGSGSVIDFAVVDDVASLLWLINLGCIDLNPWYAPCSEPDRPEYLHFDLDPTPDTPFAAVREAALIVGDVLRGLGMTPFVKTSGAEGMHLYVAICSGPSQREVWQVSKEIGHAMARAYPDLLTVVYRIADRPPRRVLVDYNQNAFGKTLASVYSVRPNEAATVSTPVTWDEVRDGCEPEDFTMVNLPQRLAQTGDLWKPLLLKRGRFDLASYPRTAHARV